MKILLVLLAAALLGGCIEPSAPPEEFYIVGNDGFHCETEQLVVEQMYLFIDGNKTGYIYPGCTFGGKHLVAKLISRTVTQMAAKVEMGGREVWVMDQSLSVRADKARLSPPKYEPIPRPTITEVKPGKHYM